MTHSDEGDRGRSVDAQKTGDQRDRARHVDLLATIDPSGKRGGCLAPARDLGQHAGSHRDPVGSPGTSAEPAGFRAVLLRDAGRACNADVSFAAAPWPRALEMARAGTASGACAASFSAERAAFAAYPMRDGAADPEKEMREQVYNLYVNSENAAGGRESSGF